jgi:hypothetical protein
MAINWQFDAAGFLVLLVTLIGFGWKLMRKLGDLLRQFTIMKALQFRQLRSNKLQGVALEKIAICQKKGCSNGETDIAVKAVKEDQEKTDALLAAAALGDITKITEEIKP